jgi:Protein of unknown function (DUF3833)
MMISRWSWMMALVALSACSSTKVADFRTEKPVFDIQKYFDGTIDAWGIVRSRDGTISQRFTVEIKAAWSGEVATLDEYFNYSDGRTSRRVRTLRKTGEKYIGTAADVIGEAQGESAGNAFRLQYVLDFPYGSNTVRLRVDDWVYLMDDNVLLNRSSISKFGYEVAQVFISFRKRGS